jgi:hypothetical protein
VGAVPGVGRGWSCMVDGALVCVCRSFEMRTSAVTKNVARGERGDCIENCSGTVGHGGDLMTDHPPML